ncbi:MAG: 7 8-Dihydro-6-hydroxymethylpterin-pyrophosphokinase [Ignavibacteria bacterium]|nr:MAG: 7 8-Dihydro-6-hydroxymethylpterin-pyrophosphokinase [Ignavibacteria bacterium]KAF0160918.1 MAG: 7 8-Dihydro-6-hydroxymethylpterin-pyrophosphokinase [Ignavibacteria bacterium]
MIDKIYLGIGSNLGNRLTNLKFAVEEINKNEKCRVLKSSAVYETTPYGEVQQDNFYNAIIEIETALGFFDLFRLLKSIERRAGRNEEPKVKWGPRELDIDIIFYNEFIYDGELLSIPHKEYNKRDFVLTPLLELAQEFKHPVLKKKLRDIKYEDVERHIVSKVNESLL